MAKIVCEVCGAAYPETSSRCPVCGSVRYSTPEPITDVIVDDMPQRESTNPTSGRYARANVKKRRKHGKKNAQLVQYIAIGCALLLLLILFLTLLFSSCGGAGAYDPTDGTTEATDPPTEAPTDISCTGITLSTESISFTQIGDIFVLSVSCEPEDTTDRVTFISSDTTVVTVDEAGQVVAVGPGSATITAVCGDVSSVCNVICDIPEETEPPTLPPETLILNRSDFSLFYKGATWQLYDGVIDMSLITFTSDNEAVATIVNGKVTAVGRGTTTVHAEFGDQKVSCIVRCSFKDDTTTEGNGGVEEDNGNTGATTYTLWNTYGKEHDNDASIKVGEKVQLFLKSAEGTKITLNWSVSTEGIVSIDGRTITGVAAGVVKLTAEHEGTKYECIIRVNAPAN